MTGKTAPAIAAAGLVCLIMGACLSTAPKAPPQSTARPLPNAHAHNDYEHSRPLFDALSHGFCSIEADVHLVDGQLLVAHDLEDVRPERTLETLYLAPLRELVKRNRGSVYSDGPSLILLIDLKSPAVRTYEALRPLLERYQGMLTEYRGGTVREGAVTVLISGNRPVNMMAEETVRYAALDGRMQDLETNHPIHLVPLISENWPQFFQWDGTGPFPEAEAARLHGIVQKAHAQGRKVRFWATADHRAFWDVLLAADVDLIGADDLAQLETYLRGRAETSP